MDNTTKPNTALIFTGGYCRIESIPQDWLNADTVIAADAGRLLADQLGIIPDYLVGDFDSSDFPQHVDPRTRVIRVPAEKDDTDTMLACRIAMEQGAEELYILGGTGGRIDHTVSNLFLLEKLRSEGIRAILCDGENRIRVLSGETAVLTRGSSKYFSVFALSDALVTLSGCKYPLNQAHLTRTLPYAVSNEITANQAEITVADGPVLLVESELHKT